VTNATTLINELITKAIRLGASDIHLEPRAEDLTVRFRVDGLLVGGPTLNKDLHASAISRVKIISSLDIAEQRLPQDGKVHLRAGEKELDLRVSTIPTIHGEKAAIRILHRNMAMLSVEELGMGREDLKIYNSIIRRTSGIVIVTGPTGCGKTTTLYATLNKISSHEVNIVTIEDPVEYELAGINQTQVNPKAGLTFARGLRSILRQDPDVIMIGEIRDEETARIAVQAAMTGHLVFSTMHTNDSAGAVSRMIDLGIEPCLLNATLASVVAQRLMRLTCKKCGGVSCEACNKTGYKGRTGMFEMLTVNSTIKELIAKGAPDYEIKAAAIANGMVPLEAMGEQKVKEGLTTKQEVSRVVRQD
jgi:type II secretory ATPase GspE/PulE/Tfp pilus assembly ATPase PilB-like protein